MTLLLTQCAACAAPLGLTSGKKCGRCSTRYCGAECQVQHWKEGGHDNLCKKIKKAGGAEQYHANKKYAESVTTAAKACAEDTKGQTCYICLEAVHARTGEGLVRGCACGDRDGVASGTTGVAHVSCLAEQAKILVAEAKENNLDVNARWTRWYKCSLCEQEYHGVVMCALGWVCWKTYLGRPETDQARCLAMNVLGNGLSEAGHEDALSVREAELAMERRVGGAQDHVLATQTNLANTYDALGRREDAMRMSRDVYSGRLKLNGEEHERTLRAANNYALLLLKLKRFEEAKSLLRKITPVARRVLGDSHDLTLRMRKIDARALYKGPGATLDDTREAVTTLEEILPTARQVFGGSHPTTTEIEESLAITLGMLGAAYSKLGDDAKARDMLERALAIFESAYGPDHPHTEGCQKALAELSSA